MSVPLGDWLSIHALRSADRPALVDVNTGVMRTYAELDERTTRLASALKQRGVRPGDRIGIFSYNNPAMLEILFATAKLGAITVMVNFRLTATEARFILDDSGTDILFASTPLLETAATASQGTEVREIIPLPMAAERQAGAPNPLEEMIAAGNPHELLIHVDPGTAAILMYTSGTTGRPKGAMITHTNLFWISIYHNAFENGLNRYDVNLVSGPLFHIAALATYTLASFYWGASNCVLESFAPEPWAEAIERYRCTKAFAVPTMWGALLQSGALDTHDVSSLHIAVTGGAPCPIPYIEALQAKGMAFTEGFGMTETAAMVSSLASAFVTSKAGSIGKPALHVELRIVNELDEEVPVGTVGELLVRGPSVIQSYWNRPDANAESFKDGWFYSGDLARCDEDGFYYIVERKKDMVISGGENVYPIEVEQALFPHEAIADVCVIGTPHEKWGETVTAVVVLAEGAGEDRAALIRTIEAYARERLAGYKVPRRYAFVESFPRTATGKVRKVELREAVQGQLIDS